MLFRLLICLIVFLPLVAAGAQLDVRLVTDEPEAVLAVLAKKKANQEITEADWNRIFASEGLRAFEEARAGDATSFRGRGVS